MVDSVIDIESVARDVRAQEQKRVDEKVATVRSLASAADQALRLRLQTEAAESEWATKYRAALQAGFEERDVPAALRPPAGVKPKPTIRKTRTTPATESRVVETPATPDGGGQ